MSTGDNVNFKAALNRFGGRHHSLHRTAKAFVQAYTGMPEQLRLHIAANAVYTLAELAHRIRGSAGVLEAAELSKLAGALEDAVRDGDIEYAVELAPQMAAALDVALEEISRFVADNPPAPADSPAQGAAVLVQQLAPLVRDGDFAAGPLLDQLATQLDGSEFSDLVQSIRTRFDALDTDDAAALAVQLQEALAARQ
jgi:HPt (histidine-containing phosphotransfer) domain-containing protein